jgi:hypothetical protein
MEVTEGVLDSMMYAFFGEDHKVPSVKHICGAESPILQALSKLWSLLSNWSVDRAGPWKVLFFAGWRDAKDPEVRRCARRQCLATAAGVFLRFDLKYSCLPWSLHQLTSASASEEAKEKLCKDLLAATSCCVPMVAEDFRRGFPSIAQMLSPLGLGAIRSWEKGLG